MIHSETFEPDSGLRFASDGKTLLLQMMALGQRLSRSEREGLSRASAEFLSEVSRKPRLGPGRARQVRAIDFPEATGGAFKAITPEAEEWLRQGVFRLGSPTYYAQLGNNPGTDGWEGHTHVFVDFGERTFSAAVTTGYNCLAFCTTRARDRSRLDRLRVKFGGADGRIVRINDVQGLAQALAAQLGSCGWRVRDVRYGDAKFVHIVSDEYAAVDELLMDLPPPRDLTSEIEHSINVRFSHLIHRDAEAGSLFTKPLNYAHEQERRLIFELDTDIAAPHFVDVHAPAALRFLDF